MNETEPNANLTAADMARADAALSAFFQAEKPRAWPAPPVSAAAPRAPQPRRWRPSHLALALSIALLALGLGFAGSFQMAETPKPSPEGAGPPSAHKPSGMKRPPSSRPVHLR